MLLQEFESGSAVVIETTTSVNEPFKSPILQDVTSIVISILDPSNNILVNEIPMVAEGTLPGRYSFVWQSLVSHPLGTYKVRIKATRNTIVSIQEDQLFELK